MSEFSKLLDTADEDVQHVVGEEKKSIQRRGGVEIGDEIVLQGHHPLHPFAATPLRPAVRPVSRVTW